MPVVAIVVAVASVSAAASAVTLAGLAAMDVGMIATTVAAVGGTLGAIGAVTGDKTLMNVGMGLAAVGGITALATAGSTAAADGVVMNGGNVAPTQATDEVAAPASAPTQSSSQADEFAAQPPAQANITGTNTSGAVNGGTTTPPVAQSSTPPPAVQTETDSSALQTPASGAASQPAQSVGDPNTGSMVPVSPPPTSMPPPAGVNPAGTTAGGAGSGGTLMGTATTPAGAAQLAGGSGTESSGVLTDFVKSLNPFTTSPTTGTGAGGAVTNNDIMNSVMGNQKTTMMMGVLQAGGSMIQGMMNPVTPAQIAELNAKAAQEQAQATMTQQQSANMASGVPVASSTATPTTAGGQLVPGNPNGGLINTPSPAAITGAPNTNTTVTGNVK